MKEQKQVKCGDRRSPGWYFTMIPNSIIDYPAEKISGEVRVNGIETEVNENNEYVLKSAPKISGMATKLVLIVLMRHASQKDATCHPAINTIASKVGCAKNTVRRALKWLEEHEYISVSNQYDEKGKQKVNIYTIKHQAVQSLHSREFDDCTGRGQSSNPTQSAIIARKQEKINKKNRTCTCICSRCNEKCEYESTVTILRQIGGENKGILSAISSPLASAKLAGELIEYAKVVRSDSGRQLGVGWILKRLKHGEKITEGEKIALEKRMTEEFSPEPENPIDCEDISDEEKEAVMKYIGDVGIEKIIETIPKDHFRYRVVNSTSEASIHMVKQAIYDQAIELWQKEKNQCQI